MNLGESNVLHLFVILFNGGGGAGSLSLFPKRQEKYLDEALTFDDGHICKRSPREITEFYLQSAESSEFFRGVVDVDLTIVSAAESDANNNKEKTSSHPILVELVGRMIGQGTRAETKEESTIEQVTLRLFCRGITLIHRSPSRPSHPDRPAVRQIAICLIFMSTLYKVSQEPSRH